MGVLGRRVLVLNSSWLPIGVTNVRTALSLLFSSYNCGEPKSRVLDPASLTLYRAHELLRPRGSGGGGDGEMGNNVIRTPTRTISVPEAIILTRYHKVPALEKPSRTTSRRFSRAAMLRRDNYTCGYCGASGAKVLLTVDHVLPQSRGGEDTFENCVTSCISCNSKKGSRTPEEAGMPLRPGVKLREPKSPDEFTEWSKMFEELMRGARED